MEDYKTLEFGINKGVATIILDRPDAANSVNALMCRELVQVAMRCDQDEGIRAVILSGRGRIFCAGGDIAAMAEDMDSIGTTVKRMADGLHTAISTFARMRPPLIISVNGTAAGAGFSLAAIGDIVLASNSARFTMAYTRSGLSPDGSSTYFLPRIIGLRRTQELMLTNRQLTAEEALSIGLVTEVVAHDHIMSRANEIAVLLSKGSRDANAAVKNLLLVSFDNGLETQMELEGRRIARAAVSDDGREGISAFLENRHPVFGN